MRITHALPELRDRCDQAITWLGPASQPCAMVFRPARGSGTQFLTPPALDLQVGVLEKRRGERVRAHTHQRRVRSIEAVAEFLYLESGRVQVEVFDEDWQLLAAAELAAGEMILLLRGGHSLTVLEAARIVEVRHGPYLGAALDKRFAPLEQD